MKNRAGVFAAAADSLTMQCVYYIVAATMVMAERGWAVALFWPLLCSAVCTTIYAVLLKKPRSTVFLTVLTGCLTALSLTVFILASKTPMTVFYVVVLTVYAGMTAGLPLYLIFNQPSAHRHLTYLDILILAFLWLLLVQSGARGTTEGRGLIAAVLLLDVGAAVGLRMSDGEQNAGALRGGLVALGAAAVMALVIMVLLDLFSRSGGVTDGILDAVGAFFARIGALLTAFFAWFSSLFRIRDNFEEITIEDGLSALTGAPAAENEAMSFNGTGIAITLAVLILAVVVFLTFRFRKKRFAVTTEDAPSAAAPAVSRISGAMKKRWLAFLASIRFTLNAFLRRDTPAGLLVFLERRAKRKKTPRRTGETMRAFVARMDENGSLIPLADALDRLYYGGKSGLPPAECRALRKLVKS